MPFRHHRLTIAATVAVGLLALLGGLAGILEAEAQMKTTEGRSSLWPPSREPDGYTVGGRPYWELRPGDPIRRR